MLFKLASRNIWRNKRRTLITAASILFAVFFAVTMNSIQKGAWDRMLDNVVNFYYGYGQIHTEGYWEDQTIDKAFALNENLNSLPQKIKKLKGLVPRIESFALASYGEKSKGVLLVGADPELENDLTDLKGKIIEGEYFTSDKSVIVAEGLANYLTLKAGDTMVFISQGYHGVNAAGKYPISGIIKFASPDLNKRMAYLPIKEAQYFYGADNLVTSLALKLDSKDDLNSVMKDIKKEIGEEDYEIMTWQEMLPDLVEAQETDKAGNYVFLVVLYVIISFGIFGTLLMMVKERSYEFGVLISIGMSRLKLGATVFFEVILLGALGALLGMLVSWPVVYYFNKNPIDLSGMGEDMTQAYENFGFDPVLPASLDPSVFLWQALFVLLIVTVLATYPLIKILRLKPIEAMHE